MKRLLSIIVILLALNARGQDPQFTQFFSNPLHLAPSFAGAIEASRVTSMYRSQWAGVGNPFVTYTFSYDHYFDAFNSGFGVLFLKDAAGTGKLGITSIGLQYSYDFQIFNTVHVRPGLYFNYMQTGIDYNRLLFSSQFTAFDNSGSKPAPPSKERVGDIDFSSSLLVYAKKVWFGGHVEHLLKPEVSLYTSSAEFNYIPLKYSFFGGLELVKKGHLLKPLDETLTFAALFRKQHTFQQLDFGLYWYKMPIVAGVWLRGMPRSYGDEKRLIQIGDMVALLVGYKISTFSIGYSYDFTISRLVTSTNGSHEVSLVYNFRHERKKKYGAVPCPSF